MSEVDDKGGFVIYFPGMTAQQISDAMAKECPECGCCCGTHWWKCSHAPIYVDPNPLPTEHQATFRCPPDYLRIGRSTLYEFRIAEAFGTGMEHDQFATVIMNELPSIGLTIELRRKDGRKLWNVFIWAIDYSELKLWVHMPGGTPDLEMLRIDRYLGAKSS